MTRVSTLHLVAHDGLCLSDDPLLEAASVFHGLLAEVSPAAGRSTPND